MAPGENQLSTYWTASNLNSKLTSKMGKHDDVTNLHYRTQALCRVSQTLGKYTTTLGKMFAESNTRQRALASDYIGK
jgi:hypothetical protein